MVPTPKTHTLLHSCTHVYAHTQTHIHKLCTHTEPQRPRCGSGGGRVSVSGGHLEARTTSDSFLPEVSPWAMPLTTSLSPPLTTQPRRSDVSIAWGSPQGLISGSASGKEMLGPAKRCDHPCSCHMPPGEEGATSPKSSVSWGSEQPLLTASISPLSTIGHGRHTREQKKGCRRDIQLREAPESLCALVYPSVKRGH